MTKQEPLSPCPLCGGAAELAALGERGASTGWVVVCTSCQAEGPTWWGHPKQGTIQAVVVGWNRRAALQGKTEVGLEQLNNHGGQDSASHGNSQHDQPWLTGQWFVFSPLELFATVFASALTSAIACEVMGAVLEAFTR